MENQAKLTPIAYKSKGYVITMILVEILLLGMFIVFSLLESTGTDKLHIYVFLLCGIVMFPYLVYLLSIPKELIYLHEKGFVIHSYPNKVIPFDQVKEVMQKNNHGRSISYSFGTIIIKTATRNHRIRCVAKLDQVKSKMVQLITQNTK